MNFIVQKVNFPSSLIMAWRCICNFFLFFFFFFFWILNFDVCWCQQCLSNECHFLGKLWKIPKKMVGNCKNTVNFLKLWKYKIYLKKNLFQCESKSISIWNKIYFKAKQNMFETQFMLKHKLTSVQHETDFVIKS